MKVLWFRMERFSKDAFTGSDGDVLGDQAFAVKTNIQQTDDSIGTGNKVGLFEHSINAKKLIWVVEILE